MLLLAGGREGLLQGQVGVVPALLLRPLLQGGVVQGPEDRVQVPGRALGRPPAAEGPRLLPERAAEGVAGVAAGVAQRRLRGQAEEHLHLPAARGQADHPRTHKAETARSGEGSFVNLQRNNSTI